MTRIADDPEFQENMVPLSIIGMATISPIRKDYWEHFFNLRYRVFDGEDKKFIYESAKTHKRDVANFIENLNPHHDILELAKDIATAGWSSDAKLWRKQESDRIKAMHDDATNGTQNAFLTYILHDYSQITAEPSEESEALWDYFVEEKPGKFRSILKLLRENMFLPDEDYANILSVRDLIHNPVQVSLLESLLKSTSVWIELDWHNIGSLDSHFIMRMEWLLTGASYERDKHPHGRSLFPYFSRTIGLRIEDYVENIIPASLTWKEMYFLLLVVYTRNLSVFQPQWPAAPLMPLIEEWAMEELRIIFTPLKGYLEAGIWSLNQYEVDAMKLMFPDFDPVRK